MASLPTFTITIVVDRKLYPFCANIFLQFSISIFSILLLVLHFADKVMIAFNLTSYHNQLLSTHMFQGEREKEREGEREGRRKIEKQREMKRGKERYTERDRGKRREGGA